MPAPSCPRPMLLSKINNSPPDSQSRQSSLTKLSHDQYCQYLFILNLSRSSSRMSLAGRTYLSRKRSSSISSLSYPLFSVSRQGKMGMQFSGCKRPESGEQSIRHVSLLLLFTILMSLHNKSPFMGKQCSLVRQSPSSFLSGSISYRISSAVSLSNAVKTTNQKYCLIFFRKEKRYGLSETQNFPLPEPIGRSSSSSFYFLMTSNVCSISNNSVFLPNWGADLRVIFRLCVSTCEGTRRIIAFFMADMPKHKWETATWFLSDDEPTNAFRRCPVQYLVLCCPRAAILSLLFTPSNFWLYRLIVLSSSETSLQTNSPSMRQKPSGSAPTVDRLL